MAQYSNRCSLVESLLGKFLILIPETYFVELQN